MSQPGNGDFSRPQGEERTGRRTDGRRTDLKAYLDGELPGLRRWLVRWHLARCRACREEVTWLKRLGEDMQDLQKATPSPQLRARILASLPDVPPARAASDRGPLRLLPRLATACAAGGQGYPFRRALGGTLAVIALIGAFAATRSLRAPRPRGPVPAGSAVAQNHAPRTLPEPLSPANRSIPPGDTQSALAGPDPDPLPPDPPPLQATVAQDAFISHPAEIRALTKALIQERERAEDEQNRLDSRANRDGGGTGNDSEGSSPITPGVEHKIVEHKILQIALVVPDISMARQRLQGWIEATDSTGHSVAPSVPLPDGVMRSHSGDAQPGGAPARDARPRLTVAPDDGGRMLTLRFPADRAEALVKLLSQVGKIERRPVLSEPKERAHNDLAAGSPKRQILLPQTTGEEPVHAPSALPTIPLLSLAVQLRSP